MTNALTMRIASAMFILVKDNTIKTANPITSRIETPPCHIGN